MSKQRNKAQPFGSRSNKPASFVRGNVIKLQQRKEQWLGELSGMLKEATAMPSAASIVMVYYRDHGTKVKDPAALNDSIRSLNTVVQNHKEACTLKDKELSELQTTLTGSQKMAESLTMINFASGVQDIMNDFANIGMYAIDQCLEPFRELAKEDDTIPSPGYMTPRGPEDIAMSEQFSDPGTTDSNMVVVDVPTAEQEAAAKVADVAVVEEKQDE